MRLQARLRPDPLDGRDRDADPGGHPPGTPVGRAVGRRLERQGDDPIALAPLIDEWTTRAGRIAEAGEAIGLEAAAPEEHGHERDAKLRRDPLVRDSIGSTENNPRSLGHPLLGRPRPDETLEHGAFRWADGQWGGGRMSHAEHRSCDRDNGLASFVSGH